MRLACRQDDIRQVRAFYRKRFTRTLKARANRQILAIIVSKELMGL